ncbi:preprotein translocase, SecE subunit [Gloeomargarita lithophora Alchichica-D10]|uniref:Protein translocase subunit SecE n=2 Tax=Gloeomargarita TaxID=1188227 RepID=A0A1J0AF03_9CYAN|nr:preprotein translocase, SecE subunit [Gloeomargarita lithophora Alchichica-D10]
MPKNERVLLARPTCMEKKEAMVAPPGGGPLGFLNNVRTELKKVIWPSRQQLISESFAVLLMVVASTLLIYLVDALFVWLSQRVFP